MTGNNGWHISPSNMDSCFKFGMESEYIWIIDLDGMKSVTNDIVNVYTQINVTNTAYQQFTGFWIYQDSYGEYAQILYSSKGSSILGEEISVLNIHPLPKATSFDHACKLIKTKRLITAE